jgi:hypothetical protein
MAKNFFFHPIDSTVGGKRMTILNKLAEFQRKFVEKVNEKSADLVKGNMAAETTI